jgi:hypothetical protein
MVTVALLRWYAVAKWYPYLRRDGDCNRFTSSWANPNTRRTDLIKDRIRLPFPTLEPRSSTDLACPGNLTHWPCIIASSHMWLQPRFPPPDYYPRGRCSGWQTPWVPQHKRGNRFRAHPYTGPCYVLVQISPLGFYHRTVLNWHRRNISIQDPVLLLLPTYPIFPLGLILLAFTKF